MEQTALDLLLQYGYFGIFFFLVLGIVGLPLPDEVMMTFIGYLASVGELNLMYTFFSALSGSACGITISYYLGKRFGYPFLKRYGNKFFITRKRLRLTQLLFRKYGNWVLFFGYFIPGVRHVTAYIAGISYLSFQRFALYAYFGSLVWCTTFVGIGYLLGAHWNKVFERMHHYGFFMFWVLVALIFGGTIRYLYQQHNRYNSVKK
ncbi:DedA family protein [Melghirimyces algeriensis]|uniref:Membrane protein DedA, SNARE-associated domain n=1 Tax=Melghirimyces algeriensis TaxID=910412 RepID=A0A521BS75_9BACL|nr:DedA family protein [Melghirimyces algeriensis]SMO50018.1 membrane protein DedA, SNARE-associated domain [Melghirimyces algeriensis]